MHQTNNQFLTVSNLISLLRLVLTIPIVWALLTQQTALAFGLCVIAAFSDWLDGAVARATQTVSEWGKVLDPIADKVLVGSVVIVLLVSHLLPIWFVCAVLGRDAVIVVGGFFARKFTPIVLPSLWSGKLAVSAIAFTGMMAIAGMFIVRDYAIVISTLLMTLSLWHYSKRLHGIIRQAQENH